MEKHQGTERQDMSMYDVLLESQIERHGGMSSYAARIGVSQSTIWRWRVRAVNPFARRIAGRERFQDDVGRSLDDLKRLSEISVSEACEIILNHDAEAVQESPTSQAPIQPDLPATSI